MTDGALALAHCSLAKTQRRRFFWAVWWTAAPTAKPFRKPDASSGGAKTMEEALAQAEEAAGRPLFAIEPRWAKAWMRVLRGEPPWPNAPRAAAPRPNASVTAGASEHASAWSILGIAETSDVDAIKRAYKQRALETHPDRGGDALLFHAVQRAYERALTKRARPTRRRR